MHFDTTLSDTVLFELPQRASATRLRRRLQSRWTVSLEEEDWGWIVFARLRDDLGDLAALLRTVEAWAAENGLGELWFQLDGRAYLLRSACVDSSIATA